MKLVLAAAAVLALAGCASSGETQLAQADCKVAPLPSASIDGARTKRIDPLAQRQAEADLRAMDNRRGISRRDPFGTIEQVLQDCNRR
jgi:hypothetical protein